MQHNLFVFFCFKVFLVIRYHKRGHADDAKMILHTCTRRNVWKFYVVDTKIINLLPFYFWFDLAQMAAIWHFTHNAKYFPATPVCRAYPKIMEDTKIMNMRPYSVRKLYQFIAHHCRNGGHLWFYPQCNIWTHHSVGQTHFINFICVGHSIFKWLKNSNIQCSRTRVNTRGSKTVTLYPLISQMYEICQS